MAAARKPHELSQFSAGIAISLGDAADWLAALPIAAALIRPHERGGFQRHASNIMFNQLGLSPTGVGAPPELAQAIAAAARGAIQREILCTVGEGVLRSDYRAALAPLGEADGSLVLLTLIDRTHEARTERSLRRELISDSLTGLPNRAGLEEALEGHSEGGASAEGDTALLLLNLARFSRINEHIGPMAGDELLITVARRLQSNLRADDILARTGGDEFAIGSRIASGKADVREIARRVRGAFDHPFRIGDLRVSIDCAVGCAIQPAAALDVPDLLRHAQIALKRAKQTDRIEIYEPETAALTTNRFNLETALRHAIEGDRLQLAFQPLIDLASGQVAGFEALARWRHDDGQVISPAEFIPVAEDSGLIVPLGQWAIQAAARTLAGWDAVNGGAPVPVYMAVNVSAIQLVRDDVAAIVRSAIDVSGISANRLMIELTESAVIGDPDIAMSVLRELKSLGTRIAMDDFGTGYSNLAYLQQLPLDVLKIDRSFVDRMVEDKDKAAIVRTIQSLAEALEMKTTAEGVETAAQAASLTAIGCNFGQGYLFARPLSADDALAFWRKSVRCNPTDS
jgi:diguanylate cyclase (GGDEF)-like protein